MTQINILWIDDEIELLKSHFLFLDRKGYHITACNNGQDALLLLEEQVFDAVILDEKLPLSVFNADILEVIAVILDEKLPESVCRASTLVSSVVNLVLIDELSAVILVEKLPESVFRLLTLVEKLELSAVILVEKLPESVFKLLTLVEKLPLSSVILVEKLPESDFKPDTRVEKLALSVVILVEKLLESAVIFTAVKLPLIKRDPVNKCVSSIVSPNIVEPLLNEEVITDTDDETIYLSACISPVTLKPSNTGESEVFNDCPTFDSKFVVLVEKLPLSTVILVENEPESVSKSVVLVEKLPLSAVILVEKLPESVFKLLTLVEKLPESVFRLLTLVENEPESVFRLLILVENEALGAVNDPEI